MKNFTEEFLIQLLAELRKDIIKETNKKYEKFEEKFRELKKEFEKIQKRLKDKNPNCIYCGSYNVVKSGKRKTVARGDIQKYTCVDCKKKFSSYSSWLDYKMRHSKEMIKKALDLRKKNLSLAQIRKKLGNKVSRPTISNWIKKNLEFQKEKTPNPPCPSCKSLDTVKYGKRTSRNKGQYQTYFCNHCGKRFN